MLLATTKVKLHDATEYLFLFNLAHAAEVGVALSQKANELFPNTKISFLGITSTSALGKLKIDEKCEKSLQLDIGSSNFVGFCDGESGAERVAIAFRAEKKVLVSKTKINPFEALNRDLFQTTTINIAEPKWRDQQTSFVTDLAEIDKAESKQTIIENTPVYKFQLVKSFDFKKGEAVTLRIKAGEIVVTLPATLSEPAFINKTVKVMTQKTKRELTGVIQADRSVEVSL